MTQTGWQKYQDLPGFEAIYLESSYVMSIEISYERLHIDMDFLLTPGHPMYQTPRAGEQYCYRTGSIDFRAVSGVVWNMRPNALTQDPEGDPDLGNLFIVPLPDGFRMSGEIGEMEVVCLGHPIVTFTEEGEA